MQKIWKDSAFYAELKHFNFSKYSDIFPWIIRKGNAFQASKFGYLSWDIWNRRKFLTHGGDIKPNKLLLDSTIVAMHVEFIEAKKNLPILPLFHYRKYGNR